MTVTAAKRRSLPKKEFGLPGERKYLVDTVKRAKAAKSYASKEHNAGRLSSSQEAQIDRKANAKLGVMGSAVRHLNHEATTHHLAKKG